MQCILNVRANVVTDVGGRKILIHGGLLRIELVLVGHLGGLSLFGLHIQKVNEGKSTLSEKAQSIQGGFT